MHLYHLRFEIHLRFYLICPSRWDLSIALKAFIQICNQAPRFVVKIGYLVKLYTNSGFLF